MIIQKNKTGELEIKTKKAQIICNDAIKINSVELEGAGEYEIGGVVVEGLADNAYLFQAEDMVVGLISLKAPIAKENIEKLSNSEVLILRLDGKIEDAVSLAGQIEPNMIVFAGTGGGEEKLKSNGVAFEKSEAVKVSKNDLLADQKSYFVEVSDGETP